MSSRKQEFVGSLMIFVCGALWGLIGPFIETLHSLGASPALSGFIRMFFAFLIMLAVTVWRCGFAALRLSRKAFISCLLLGIICQGMVNIFYNSAVPLAGIAISAVLMNTAPVFTMLASRVFFHERLTRQKVLALAVNVLGCIFASTGGNFDLATISLTGIILGALSGMGYGMTAIIGRVAGDETNPYVASTYSYLFAAIFLALYARPWSIPEIRRPSILLVGFLFALIPTAIAYLLYYTGLQYVRETSKVPVIATSEIAVAALAGVLFFGENLNAIHLMGIALVFFSIVMMSRHHA